MKRMQFLVVILMGISIVLGLPGCSKNDGMKKLTGTGKIVVTGCDWGPAITKVILSVPEELDQEQHLSPDLFVLQETRKPFDSKKIVNRTVTDIYFSDENGNRIETSEPGNEISHISLDLHYSPEEGSPFYYDGFNRWLARYSLEVKMQTGKALQLSNHNQFTLDDLTIAFKNKPDPGSVLLPETAEVHTEGIFTGKEGNSFTYASFSPANASEENKRPLVIWLHGAGEGGNDPLITIYGNKVTALVGDEFQKIMDGAYILVPQTSSVWKRNENGDYFSNENPGDHSMYLHDLKELIDQYANVNHVDKNRIIVGGCSNGGFMAMDLILHYPDYFSAAYPICEMYEPELISDEKLEGIKDLPIWFIYAANDATVVPALYEEPLLKRLDEIGTKNIHVTVFSDVHDTSGKYEKDGKPYPYYGHWSWIYFFNNECVDENLSVWQWLSEQRKQPM